MKFLAVALVLLAMVGCIQCTSFMDGMMGTPMDEATKTGDLPFWYHFGHFTFMGISDLITLIRIVGPVILPLL